MDQFSKSDNNVCLGEEVWEKGMGRNDENQENPDLKNQFKKEERVSFDKVVNKSTQFLPVDARRTRTTAKKTTRPSISCVVGLYLQKKIL